jgi:hypothetical protein
VTDQNPAPTNRSPTNDAPLTLSSGTVVRMRNLVVYFGRNTRNMTVFIETPTPASDSTRLADEAYELANLHREFADKEQLGTIIIAVCRTQACSELRETSTEQFVFARTADGDWAAAPNK